MSDPFFGAYTELIDELFRANGQAALAIDDPTLRRGVELTDLASHQIENVARLTRVLLLAGVSGGLTEPADVAEAAGLLGQVETGVEQVRQLGTGRYQPAAEKVDQEFTSSGFTDLAASAIETGEVQVTETMASLSREDDEGYNGFRNTVNGEIEERADELLDESTATQRRYLALGALALIVAGVGHLAGVPLDHQAAAVADPAGQVDGRGPPARRGHRHPRDAARRRRHGPRPSSRSA